MEPQDLQRREFLAGLAALQLVGALDAASSDGMIYRKLGSTGERVSAIGLGGYHIGIPKDENEGIRIIRSAVDRGHHSSTTAGITTTATARSAWARRCRTATARRLPDDEDRRPHARRRPPSRSTSR